MDFIESQDHNCQPTHRCRSCGMETQASRDMPDEIVSITVCTNGEVCVFERFDGDAADVSNSEMTEEI